MNTYTLDPAKSEVPAASTAASAPTPAPLAAQFQVPPHYPYYPYQYPQAPVVQPVDLHKIRDWLPWSIINLFLGGLFPGVLPLIFSIICRSHKSKNNVNGAQTMSTLALVFNIIITIMGVIALIAIFIYLFVYTRQIGNNNFYTS